MACVVQVWFERDRPSEGEAPKPRFDLVETEFPDFAAFCEAMEHDQVIGGALLFTRWGEGRGERVIVRETPIAFRGSAVVRALLPTWKIVRELED